MEGYPVRKKNILSYLCALARRGGCSRHALAAETGLSLMTVGKISETLIAAGAVREEKSQSNQVGRRALQVDFHPDRLFLSLSLGRGLLTASLFRAGGEVLLRRREVLPAGDAGRLALDDAGSPGGGVPGNTAGSDPAVLTLISDVCEQAMSYCGLDGLTGAALLLSPEMACYASVLPAQIEDETGALPQLVSERQAVIQACTPLIRTENPYYLLLARRTAGSAGGTGCMGCSLLPDDRCGGICPAGAWRLSNGRILDDCVLSAVSCAHALEEILYNLGCSMGIRETVIELDDGPDRLDGEKLRRALTAAAGSGMPELRFWDGSAGAPLTGAFLLVRDHWFERIADGIRI